MPADQPVDSQPPRPSLLTRRHVLVAGAAAGSVVALRGVPVLGQEAEGEASTTSSSTTTSTTTTTTAPAPPPSIAAPSTTQPPPPITEPAHPTDTGDRPPTRSFDTLLQDSPDRGIMFPVFPNSATTWNRNQDTYGNCRGGSGCPRRHQGEDLMAPKMTKLLAVKSGTVVELRHRPQQGLSGGNSLYIRGDDGWFYCYLHLNNDSPGTDNASNRVEHTWGPGLRQFATGATTMNETAARGYRVREGELIGYVGDSGNAEDSGSHLHFEIRKPASGSFSSETTRLWASASVNPRESLRNAKPAKESVPVSPTAFRPWTSSTAFLTAQFKDFLGRNPSNADLTFYRDLLDYGTRSPEWVMQVLLESKECDTKTHAIARLYQAFYKRLPDTGGFNYWMDAARNGGWGLHRIAEQFTRAPEFRTMYGTLTNPEYVDLVYRNVLGRNAEPAGKQWWVEQLDAGMTRGRAMIGFSESPEYKKAQSTRMHVVSCYGVMLNRVPTASELSTWVGLLDGGGTNSGMIGMLRTSDEYIEANS